MELPPNQLIAPEKFLAVDGWENGRIRRFAGSSFGLT